MIVEELLEKDEAIGEASRMRLLVRLRGGFEPLLVLFFVFKGTFCMNRDSESINTALFGGNFLPANPAVFQILEASRSSAPRKSRHKVFDAKLRGVAGLIPRPCGRGTSQGDGGRWQLGFPDRDGGSLRSVNAV